MSIDLVKIPSKVFPGLYHTIVVDLYCYEKLDKKKLNSETVRSLKIVSHQTSTNELEKVMNTKFILENARVIEGKTSDIVLCNKCRRLDSKSNHKCRGRKQLKKKRISPISPEAVSRYLNSNLWKAQQSTHNQ